MPPPDSNTDIGDELERHSREMFLRPGAAAGIHTFLRGGLVLGLALVAARRVRILENFGTELRIHQQLFVMMSTFAANYWYVAFVIIVVAAAADWCVLRILDTPQTRSKGRLRFWGNVAAPSVLALFVGVVIAMTASDLNSDLS